MNVLVTGSTGFVGSRIIELLSINEEFTPIAASRYKNTHSNSSVQNIYIDDLGSDNSWINKLDDVQVIIHTAARVHIMKDNATDPLSEFRRINFEGTLNLAQQAVNAGVKRFIFISSIKVNGESTLHNKPFTEQDIPAPVDPYGISKYETEQALLNIAKNTNMEIVCIRPVLVYGPNVKGNFLSMMKWLSKSFPLPFGSIHNKRSFVALDNLVDLILTCIKHPSAANEVFLVSDGEDLSTTELLERVADSFGIKARLLSVNQNVLELLLMLVGQKKLAQRLCGSLQVDISKAKNILNWTPAVSMDYELKKTSKFFLNSKSS